MPARPPIALSHRRPPGRRSPPWWLLLWCVLWLGATPAPAPESKGDVEYGVKAALLYNFCRYVEWPVATVPAKDSVLRIGLLAEDPVAAGIKLAMVGKKADAHPIEIVLLKDPAQVTNCQIFFLSRAMKARAPALLALTQTAPVLTVGEFDGFIERGGLINVLIVDESLRLEGNVDAARLLGVQISGKLAGTIHRRGRKP